VAVMCVLQVALGTLEHVTALEQQVGRRLEAAGGPPEGLMFVCVHPDGQGFRILMVFRSAEAAHAEVNGPLRGDAASVGLDLGEPALVPVWSMALPGEH
jgi:hypothetical protein